MTGMDEWQARENQRMREHQPGQDTASRLWRENEALKANQERLWCTACGTVTRDKTCDCNRCGPDHEMHRDPHFVNYADAMQEEARALTLDIEAWRQAMRDLRELAIVNGDVKRRIFDLIMFGPDVGASQVTNGDRGSAA